MTKTAFGWKDTDGKAHKIQFVELKNGLYRVGHYKESDGEGLWNKLNETVSGTAPTQLSNQSMTPSHLKDKEALI